MKRLRLRTSIFSLISAIVVVGGIGLYFANQSSAFDFKALVGGKEDVSQVLESDIIYGNEKAPVTIIEYASLTCPHCANFHNKVFPELASTYVDTGKVRFIHRPFPLNEPALKGAQLAACAGKDRYYTFIKVLFETQDRWAFDPNYTAALAQIAKVGGFSQPEFDSCMANKELEKNILIIRKEGTDQMGVNSTPTFFINGKKLEGEQTMAAFSTAIEQLLGTSAAKP